MEAQVVPAYEQEQWKQMARWLHLLPEEQIQSSPFLLIARAWVLQFQGQFKEYQRSLMAADQLVAASRSNESRECALHDPMGRLLHALIAIEWCRSHFSRGQVQEGLESARAALEWTLPDHGHIKTYAMEFLALFYQLDGQEEAALVTLQQALQDHAEHLTSTARLLIAQAFVYLLSGKLPQLEQTAQHLLQLAQHAELRLSQPMAHWFLGVVSYENNDLEAAVYHFSAVIANQHLSRSWIAHDAMCMLALCYQAQGLKTRAKETAHALPGRVQEEHNRVQLMMAYVFCGQLALLQMRWRWPSSGLIWPGNRR